MDIERKGGNCIVMAHKKYSFVTDPKLSTIGLKDQAADATAQLVTQSELAVPGSAEGVVIDGPGEYEVHNCSVRGIAAEAYRSNDDTKKTATIYSVELDDYVMAIVGHIKPKLSEEQLEEIGVVDILVVPIGGYGYTLDPKEAVEVVREISPKAIIPTHYAEDGVTYEVPQAPLEDFIKELGAQHEVLPKLKLKPGAMPEALTVYELSRTK
jgi:L-ascorbate metabolism protein UlaG (beta-lactamase superfamily)